MKAMCNVKSGIILKDRVFVPAYDSHEKMLKELGIKDDRRTPNFIRVELSPIDGDMFTAVEDWKYRVDQDFRPDWYVPEVDEKRMRAAVKEWYDEHVFIRKNDLNIVAKNNDCYYLKDCGNATVEASGNATVEAYGNATVRASGNATVEAYDNATVEASGNATVEAYGNATVVIPSWSSNKKENIVLMQNSTLKDCNAKTLYQSGDWKLVSVKE
jgi:hypothetical protein